MLVSPCSWPATTRSLPPFPFTHTAPYLAGICDELLQLVDKYIMPNCVSADSRVFFLKLNADYLRYVAEYVMT